MEEGCFSSVRSKRGLQSNNHSQKISDGLTYPIYIITSAFNSPHLNQVQKVLENERITLSFQNSLERLKKIENTYQKRFFVILNDFPQTPILDGEFHEMPCQIAQYPKQSLETILQFYRIFVQKEKSTSSLNSVITQLIFLSNMSQKKQNISSTDMQTSSKIQMRSISKIIHNYKSSFPKKLFVYSNPNDDEFFLQCLKIIEKYQIQNAEFITRIEQYLKFLPAKEDIRFFVIMSQYSAINLRKYFKRSDDIVVCTKKPENCVPLLKGKVTQIICDTKTLDNLITKNFNYRIKNENLSRSSTCKVSSGENFLDVLPNSNIKLCVNTLPQLSCSPSSIKSSDHLKITQQFSLLNLAKKELNIQSSIIAFTITPSESSISEAQKKIKLKSTLNAISPIKVYQQEVIFTPLKIVQLQHLDLVACNGMDLESNLSDNNVFSEVKNTLEPRQFQQKNSQISKQRPSASFSSSGAQNFIQTGWSNPQGKSQESRASQRTSRNSRIVERYKKLNKEKKNI